MRKKKGQKALFCTFTAVAYLVVVIVVIVVVVVVVVVDSIGDGISSCSGNSNIDNSSSRY